MPPNKDRLYVALYARGGNPTMPGKEDTYHWALIVGPKVEEEDSMGFRYHAKERRETDGSSKWFFEERECALIPTSWNCVFWVKEALEVIKVDPKALGTSVVGWERVRNEAMAYCQRKKDQHRFDG
ncbi:hypothetical protein N7491_008287 [Penicillium cf. griseofulvum]|uniref:Uncharacterized protein n=1 Tax=Penicillium cf. griseofulvum TaxID=2972120 RepID=A0A9W9M5I8_9EURO|nr:hypothetical protein N7472_008682 [Penicillium cf. griseofulvum]KAJ5427845.1 hypothetical protein N7491_008287 [Penicillium cf. griseofulvum]KAJ5432049.1 hypothetical protein N7445_008547 [Penicillium cf. griseofulvum]